MTNPDDLAFPCDTRTDPRGLTKRELFAALLMAGLSANPERDCEWEDDAKAALNGADALIAALNQEKP